MKTISMKKLTTINNINIFKCVIVLYIESFTILSLWQVKLSFQISISIWCQMGTTHIFNLLC